MMLHQSFSDWLLDEYSHLFGLVGRRAEVKSCGGDVGQPGMLALIESFCNMQRG